MTDSDETNRFEPTPVNKETIMSKKNQIPVSVRISLYVSQLAGETAGVANEIKICSKIQYRHSKAVALVASRNRIRNFVPKS